MPRADSLVFPAAPPAENVAVSVCTEGLRSGRTRRTRNALGGLPASWVQIPPPPPIFLAQRHGRVLERSNRHAWRACVPSWYRGFKSHPFRHVFLGLPPVGSPLLCGGPRERPGAR